MLFVYGYGVKIRIEAALCLGQVKRDFKGHRRHRKQPKSTINCAGCFSMGSCSSATSAVAMASVVIHLSLMPDMVWPPAERDDKRGRGRFSLISMVAPLPPEAIRRLVGWGLKARPKPRFALQIHPLSRAIYILHLSALL